MDERNWLAERFEEQWPRLRAVAYRMLGSLSEAEDAVQEAWLRLSGSAHGEIDNLGAWLTTVVVERTPDAARQLASRARRRVRERNATPDADAEVQRSVVEAFVAAARDGDFHGLVAVLDPEVVLRADVGALAGKSIELHGAEQVARSAQSFSRLGLLRLPVLVNGAPGLVCMLEGKPFSVMAFTIRGGKIAEIDVLSDPERLSQLDLTVLDD